MGGLFETLSGAKGLRAEGKSAQNIAEFNARIAEEEATAAKQRSAFASKRQAKKGEQIKSALAAKLAGAGGLGSPVAADLAAEQAAELELEDLLIGFEGEVAAKRSLAQAEVDRLGGRLARQRGKSAARAANVQFGVQLATLAAGAGGGGGSPLGTSTLPKGVAGPTKPTFLTGFVGRR